MLQPPRCRHGFGSSFVFFQRIHIIFTHKYRIDMIKILIVGDDTTLLYILQSGL